MSRTLPMYCLSALLGAAPALAEAPRVAVDIAPVHSLVARVMAGVGAPDLIVAQGASPHEYSLRPSEARALQEADLVVWVGPDLTPWLADAVASLSGSETSLALLHAAGTLELPVREGALFEGHDHGQGEEDDEHADGKHADDKHADDEHADGKHADDKHADDKHGHDEHGHDEHGHDEHAGDEHAHSDHGHGAIDPHAWLSPQNGATWLGLIAAELSALDPANAATYAANAATGRAEMAVLSAEINTLLAPVRGGRFVVFHDAYQYFETSFDLPAAGSITLSDASDPSPARIAEVQGRIRADTITCVLAEPQFNPGLVATVMDGTEARTGLLDPLGADLEPGAALYPNLLRNLATTLAGCL